jgi:hypothetical protein
MPGPLRFSPPTCIMSLDTAVRAFIAQASTFSLAVNGVALCMVLLSVLRYIRAPSARSPLADVPGPESPSFLTGMFCLFICLSCAHESSLQVMSCSSWINSRPLHSMSMLLPLAQSQKFMVSSAYVILSCSKTLEADCVSRKNNSTSPTPVRSPRSSSRARKTLSKPRSYSFHILATPNLRIDVF